jgi:uncharacterized protein YlxP (DUF503 family)
MWIGVGRIVLDFYNNDSLKKKRNAMESLCKDLRKTFNLSALEVSEIEDLEKCVLGFAAVMPEAWKEKSAHDFIKKICGEIDNTAFARVSVEDCELFWHGPGT